MTKDTHGETDEPKGGRPGPVDHGKNGGMATRENAPELRKTPPTPKPRPTDETQITARAQEDCSDVSAGQRTQP